MIKDFDFLYHVLNAMHLDKDIYRWFSYFGVSETQIETRTSVTSSSLPCC